MSVNRFSANKNNIIQKFGVLTSPIISMQRTPSHMFPTLLLLSFLKQSYSIFILKVPIPMCICTHVLHFINVLVCTYIFSIAQIQLFINDFSGANVRICACVGTYVWCVWVRVDK